MNIDITNTDPVIHSPVRIAILTVLISVVESDFAYLKKITNTSDGNLSSHLSKLENREFIIVEKYFSGKRPKTRYRITEKGRDSFSQYLKALENIINTTKEDNLIK